MRVGEKSFILYLSGAADNDVAIMNYLTGQKEYRDAPCAVFKLDYTAPYQDFTAIREFQCAMRYRPFADKAWRRKVAIVDLSEWIGHEKEDFLEIFCKFLHDFRSFFWLEYVFTVGAADRDAVQGLYRLISEYLCEGRLVEDNMLTDSRALGRLLKENYPLDTAVAEKLAGVFVAGQIRGLTQLHTVMEDFLARMDLAEGRRVTETQVLEAMCSLTDSKLFLLYEDGMKKWQREAEEFRGGERNGVA